MRWLVFLVVAACDAGSTPTSPQVSKPVASRPVAAVDAPAPTDPPRSFEFISDDRATIVDAKFAPSGALIVAGTFSGTLAVGSAKLHSGGPEGYIDAFLARIERDGQVAWLKRIGVVNEVSAIAIGADSSIAVAGDTSYIEGKPAGHATDFRTRASIALLDADGSLRWQRELRAAYRSNTNDVAFASDGGVVACGAFGGVTEFGTVKLDSVRGRFNPAYSSSDAFVVRLDAKGTVEWVASGGGPDDDGARAVAVLPSGDIAIAGSFGPRTKFGDTTLAGPSETTTRIANPSRIFVATYTPRGALRATSVLGHRDFVGVAGLAALQDGTLIVRGEDADITTNARHPFLAWGSAVRDIDALIATVAGGGIMSLRRTDSALVIERHDAERTTRLASIARKTTTKLEPVALAVAPDGRIAVTAQRGDFKEIPIDRRTMSVSSAEIHGVVAIVSTVADIAKVPLLQ